MMSLFHHLAIVTLYTLLWQQCGYAAVYQFFDQLGLTSLPANNFTNNVTHLRLGQNSLVTVDYFPPLPSLKSLSLKWNRIEEFPDLQNVSDVITHLYVSGNRLHVINTVRLAQLTALIRLELAVNFLTSFPEATLANLNILNLNANQFARCPLKNDLYPLLSELHMADNQVTECDLHGLASFAKIHIENNNLTSVPDFLPFKGMLWFVALDNNPIREVGAPFRDFTALTNIYLRYLPLDSIPDMFSLPSSLNYLNMEGSLSAVPCTDPMLPWVSVYRLASGTVVTSQKDCFRSQQAGIDFASKVIDPEEFVNPARRGAVQKINWGLKPLGDATVRGVVPVRGSLLTGLSPLGCARECLATPSCLMFYLEDGGCQLTDATTMTSPGAYTVSSVYIRV